MLDFIFHLFRSDPTGDLGYQSMRVIACLLTFRQLDLLPHIPLDFPRALVNLLSFPNKAIAHYSLVIIQCLLAADFPADVFTELGLYGALWSAVPEDGELRKRNLTLIGWVLMMLCQSERPDLEAIFDGALRLVATTSEGAVQFGFALLTALAEGQFAFDLSTEILELFLKCVTMSHSALDRLFEFVANSAHPHGEEAIEWLFEHGFFRRLLERIRDAQDFAIAGPVFRFLTYWEAVPAPEDPELEIAVALAREGPMPAKAAVLCYLHTILHCTDESFAVALLAAGIVEVIAEVVGARAAAFAVSDALSMLVALRRAADVAGVEFGAVPGFAELAEALAGAEGENGGMYDEAIEQIVAGIDL